MDVFFSVRLFSKCKRMEVQTQLQNNPYEMVMVKRENASSPSGEIKNPCEYACTK